MRGLMLLLMIISLMGCKAQSDCADSLLKRELITHKEIETKFDSLIVCSEIYKADYNSITLKNKIKQTDNRFDLIITRNKNANMDLIVCEYSPINSSYQKITFYKVDNLHRNLKYIKQRQTIVPGITYPNDSNWTSSLNYNKNLNENIYLKLLNEILMK